MRHFTCKRNPLNASVTRLCLPPTPQSPQKAQVVGCEVSDKDGGFDTYTRRRFIDDTNQPNRCAGTCQPFVAAEGRPLDVLQNTRQPYLLLVDDDGHSARLLTRMLLAHGAPSIQWIESSEEGLSQIKSLLDSRARHLPGLVVVDLKSSSNASAEFVSKISAMERSNSLLIVVMAVGLDRITRESLLQAGADAVFERHSELQAYRAEAAAVVSFWVRHQRLEAVGT